jgi:SepF-like predicted cell division protein (DUF552 family)
VFTLPWEAGLFLLVLGIFAIEVAVLLAFNRTMSRGQTARVRGTTFVGAGAVARSTLDLALTEATQLAAEPLRSVSILGLKTAARVCPGSYQAACHSIAELYRRGHIVSVDLSELDAVNAIRLVDFCSGLAAATGGGVIRAALEVFIVTPRP